jgi:O2-independent ubiquinone biosynthesis accessory factor UbiT
MERRARNALFRFVLAKLPAPFLQFGLDFGVAAMSQRHPSLPERLRSFSGARILIEPQEAPCGFLLALGEPPGRLSLFVAQKSERFTARVCGPSHALLDLLEGSVDGDALFFQRDLAVSGDTEAIVALRNAVDSEEIDLVEDLVAALGPLGGLARAAFSAFSAFAALADGAAAPRTPLRARGS